MVKIIGVNYLSLPPAPTLDLTPFCPLHRSAAGDVFILGCLLKTEMWNETTFLSQLGKAVLPLTFLQLLRLK